MKKITLSLLSALAIVSIYAQPNFTSADMPNIGDQDTVMYLNYQPMSDSLDFETGDGYTWDFTKLPFSSNFKTFDNYRVKTHAVSMSFPNATIEEFISDGTSSDVNLFSYSNDTLYIHRLGPVSGGFVPKPPIASITFPIQFGSQSVLRSDLTQGIVLSGERITTVTYDGFGTLKMPGKKSYTNVFRLKKVEHDTNFINHSSNDFVSYIWYKQGGQVPLLRANYTGVDNQYHVFGSKSTNTTSVEEFLSKAIDLKIYPNPSKGCFTFTNLTFVPDQIEVYNAVGEKVFTAKDSKTIDLTNSSAGIYIVTVREGSNRYSQKIIIE